MSFNKQFIFSVRQGSAAPVPPKGGIYYISYENDPKIHFINSDGVVAPAYDKTSVTGSTGSTINVPMYTYGFDREALYNGSKELGIMEFCFDADSEMVHTVGSDANGTYFLETGRTAFADGTALTDKTLSIWRDPSLSEFSYWYDNEKIFHSEDISKKITLAENYSGYIYFDENGELANIHKSAEVLIKETTLIAYIGLEPTDINYFGDERHGIHQDSETHLQIHTDGGFYMVHTPKINGVALNQTGFANFESSIGKDEDVTMFLASATTVPKMFKSGSTWMATQNDSQLTYMSEGSAYINAIDSEGNGSLVILTQADDRMGTTLCASNNKIYPYFIIVGQKEYGDRRLARKRVPFEWDTMKKVGLMTPEIQHLATFIIKKNGQIQGGDDGEVYVAWDHDYPMDVWL